MALKPPKTSTKLLLKRVANFLAGTFEARDGLMWCKFCDVPVRYDHPNYAKYHVEQAADHGANIDRKKVLIFLKYFF